MSVNQEGTFARKQAGCSNPIVAWSHRARFDKARRLVRDLAGQRLLDFGCGDGTFLGHVADLFPRGVGVERDPRLVEECRRRWSCRGLDFRDVTDSDLYQGEFQLVTCMEVLEHLVPTELEEVLDRLSSALCPNGRLVISVPIEVGPTLFGKEVVRTIAGWLRQGDYRWKEQYSIRELARMVFAGTKGQIERPILREREDPRREFYGHKGFNWHSLVRVLEQRFVPCAMDFSPLAWSRGWFSSQAWWVGTRPR